MNDVAAGRNANKNGQTLQNKVMRIFSRKGVQTVNYRHYWKMAKQNKSILLKNVPYLNIAGARTYSEFVLLHQKLKMPIRIECKWQSSQGTLDEKLFLLYHNMTLCVREPVVIVIVDGGGARDEWINWLKNACNKTHDKDIKVMNIKEFSQWVKQLL